LFSSFSRSPLSPLFISESAHEASSFFSVRFFSTPQLLSLFSSFVSHLFSFFSLVLGSLVLFLFWFAFLRSAEPAAEMGDGGGEAEARQRDARARNWTGHQGRRRRREQLWCGLDWAKQSTGSVQS
jgi:hypothetical protein